MAASNHKKLFEPGSRARPGDEIQFSGSIAGGRSPQKHRVRELWAAVARRGGAAQWVVDALAKNGIKYRHSDRDRSAIYADCLPIFTSGRARLLDSARLANQFASLERKTSSLGRDKIDHGPGGHDDLCNAAALSMVLASVEKKMVFHSPELNYGGGSYYGSFHNGAHVPAGPFELGASMSSPPDLRC